MDIITPSTVSRRNFYELRSASHLDLTWDDYVATARRWDEARGNVAALLRDENARWDSRIQCFTQTLTT